MLGHDTAIEKIPVKRGVVLERLKKNLITHLHEYEDSYIGYRDKTVALLASAAGAASAAAAGELPVYFDLDRLKLPVPESHVEDYELAIDIMTNWDGEVVELSPADYARFMRDKWAWAERHRATFLSNSRPAGGGGDQEDENLSPQGPRGFIRPVREATASPF